MKKDKDQQKAEKKLTKQERTEKIKNFISVPEIFGSKKENNQSEYIQKFNTSKDSVLLPQYSKYSDREKAIFVTLGILFIHVITLLVRYGYAYLHLQPIILSNNGLYLLFAAITPYITWVLATNENYWAFHKRKRQFFLLCTANLVLVLCQPLYTLVTRFSLNIIKKIPTNPLFTVKMVELLGILITTAIMGLILYVVYIQFEPLILSDNLKREIELFKFQHIKDNREDREYKYDVHTIKNLENGKSVTIKENDRYLQTALNGASGTGKTSTTFGGIIRDDLDQKVKNREKRQEALLRLIEKKQAYIQGPLREFEESAIMPAGNSKAERDKNQKKIDQIKKKYPDCGMTIVAPNNSMIEDIIKMANVREINVNTLDPMRSYTMQYHNVKEVSINPFYIPLNLAESERVIRISEAATVFSDVLIATNQMGGTSDTYFTDIALAVSSNISAVVMLAKNIEGKQAYIDDIQECISHFDNLRPYVEIIEKNFGIAVETASTGLKNQGAISAERIQEMYVKGNVSFAQKAAAKKNPYYFQILFVKQELLGAGAEEMYSQARGLRNLINKIMADPRIKRTLSADNDRIDFDKILYNNEITVVNTALELGKNVSTSFGLFFLLLHRASVLRRPVATRTPHFLWVDECAQYIHPFFDDVIALYRQYKVAAVLTLQTLTQLEKNAATAYLKNVFLGAGTHIVFGRLAPEEMKLYSAMSGITREMTEQKTTSENSVFTSAPSYSESVRTTLGTTVMLEGSDLRILDFLELTIFTVNAGRVLPGQQARTFFLGKDAFEPKPLTKILWEKVAPEAFKVDGNEEIEPEDTKKEASLPDEEIQEKKPEEPLSFADKITDKVLTEEVLTQTLPKQDKIEEKEIITLSLNELYTSLIKSDSNKQETINTMEPAKDIDYAAASREFNKRKHQS